MKKIFIYATAFAFSMTFASCEENTVESEMEDVGEELNEAGEAAGEEIEEETEKVKENIEESTEDAKQSVEETSNDVEESVKDGVETVKKKTTEAKMEVEKTLDSQPLKSKETSVKTKSTKEDMQTLQKAN